MADPGAVLKFPGGKPPPAETPLPLTSKGTTVPKLSSYDYDETVNLYQIATSVKKKAEDLILFVEQNRSVARQAGIEMLAVQLTSILEGEKFQRVVDSLEDSVYRRIPVALTQAGVDKVHRMERLIADADHVIVNYMNGRKVEPMMGQSSGPSYSQMPFPVYANSGSSDAGTWIPVVIIGIAGIIGVIAIIALTNRPREAAPVAPAPALASVKAKSRKT
jgi:hypothetical protein